MAVRRHKWIPGFMLAIGAILLFAACMKLLFVQRICSLSGLTWDHVVSLAFSRPDPAQTYKGVEVLAAGGVEASLLYLFAAFVALSYCVGAKRQREKDIYLLELTDKGKRPNNGADPIR